MKVATNLRVAPLSSKSSRNILTYSRLKIQITCGIDKTLELLKNTVDYMKTVPPATEEHMMDETPH